MTRSDPFGLDWAEHELAVKALQRLPHVKDPFVQVHILPWHAPAQALAASVADILVRESVSPWRGYNTWLRLHPDDDDFTIGQMRYMTTMAPVRPALERFKHEKVTRCLRRSAGARAHTWLLRDLARGRRSPTACRRSGR